MAGDDVRLGLDAERARSVHHAGDSASELGLDDYDLDLVGRGAVDTSDLGHLLELVQNVDREAFAQEDDEGVPGSDRACILDRERS